MKLPLELTFRNLDHSDALETAVREKAAKLDQFFPFIMSCRVTVEANHAHHHKGNLHHVRIILRVPGQELVVSRDPKKHQAHEDVYVAVRDAFDAARRKLEDYARKLRNEVKVHEVPPHGRILEIVEPEEYGRILSADGREIYFHRNSVVNGDFQRLQVGDEVRFAEEMGEQGPQASSVQIVGKHHIVG